MLFRPNKVIKKNHNILSTFSIPIKKSNLFFSIYFVLRKIRIHSLKKYKFTAAWGMYILN